MKKYLLFILVTLISSTCSSPEKLVLRGNYDAAIDKCIKKMVKGKAENEDKEMLDKSYRLANQSDQERIDYLLTEGRPENWDEIYRRYTSMSNRQSRVQKVIPFELNGRTVSYEYIDYNTRIAEAKANAADFFYNRGKQQMALGTKEGYRQAFTNFEKVRYFRASDYPDLDKLTADARYLGTSRVLVEVVNSSHVEFPEDFYSNITSINTSGLNSTWVEYHLKRSGSSTDYDYFIRLNLQLVEVTPGDYETREYIRKKKVKDGFDYVLDAKGNVMKDSVGNDIKIPRYKELSCVMVETRQFKTATLKGEVEYVSIEPRRILTKEPVAGTSVFENVYGRAIGDIDALEPGDQELVQREKLPFPDDLSLLYDCSNILRQAFNDLVHSNRNRIY